MVGRCCTPRRRITPVKLFTPQTWVCRPPARMHVRLLGPCFKTGRMKSPLRQRLERAGGPRGGPVPRDALRSLGRSDGIGRALKPDFCPAGPAHADQRPASSGGPARAVPHPTGAHTRPPFASPSSNFKHFLTLFSKSFSSFPRGTCSLSVSRQYLALEGIYLPLRAAFPNSPTRRQRLVELQGLGPTGFSPSPTPLSRGLGPSPQQRTLLQTTTRAAKRRDFQAGLLPVRSPLLGESLLVSFPPLSDMLKLSG
ncbi:hypothetical protein Mapa_007216 [Marchantia paleacea]|nr:hypothetical protein Mapa_007216 [Marchantia paleacea]